MIKSLEETFEPGRFLSLIGAQSQKFEGQVLPDSM